MSRQNEISDAINSLWAGYIEKIVFDICNFQIQLKIIIYKTDGPEEHVLIFEGVSSFFFANQVGDNRFNIDPWEKAELSEIYYFEKPCNLVEHNSDKPGTLQYFSEPNFYLEIWSSAFMIEAKAITLDGIRHIARE
jgi:hypothetical protein